MSVLRAELSSHIDRVRAGEEVVITERGIPVARIVPIDTATLIEQLTQKGVIARPDNPVKRSARGRPRLTLTPGPTMSDIVIELRG